MTAGQDPDLRVVLASSELDEEQRAYIEGRWYNQVRWMDARAGGARRKHFALRMLGLIGSAVVTGLLAIDLACDSSGARFFLVALSLLVGLSVGLEELYHFGETWGHYRRHSELLKSEGFRFAGKVGIYAEMPSVQDRFRHFVERVEDLLSDDVSRYFQEMTRPSGGGGPQLIGPV